MIVVIPRLGSITFSRESHRPIQRLVSLRSCLAQFVERIVLGQMHNDTNIRLQAFFKLVDRLLLRKSVETELYL